MWASLGGCYSTNRHSLCHDSGITRISSLIRSKMLRPCHSITAGAVRTGWSQRSGQDRAYGAEEGHRHPGYRGGTPAPGMNGSRRERLIGLGEKGWGWGEGAGAEGLQLCAAQRRVGGPGPCAQRSRAAAQHAGCR